MPSIVSSSTPGQYHTPNTGGSDRLPPPFPCCRYRKWKLHGGESGPEIVVRCELDAALRTSDASAPQTLLVKALNEYDLKSQVRHTGRRTGRSSNNLSMPYMAWYRGRRSAPGQAPVLIVHVVHGWYRGLGYHGWFRGLAALEVILTMRWLRRVALCVAAAGLPQAAGEPKGCRAPVGDQEQQVQGACTNARAVACVLVVAREVADRVARKRLRYLTHIG